MIIRRLPSIALTLLAQCAVASLALAQTPSRDTLRLGALHRNALEVDPRSRQADLLAAQTRLRLRSIGAERLPTLSVESVAQYQSDVARIPLVLPGGVSLPSPPHDTYDARLVATQPLYDPGLGARRSVESAQLALAQSRVATSLYTVRQQVNDAFFAALRAQAQVGELEAAVTDLEAQLRVAASRVREGSALASEELAIRAELLQRRQLVAEWEVARLASLAVLSALTGVPADSASVLEAQELGDEVAQVRAAIGGVRARPEYEQFARSRALLERQERARSAQDRPRVSAFGRAGYGRPGLNPLDDKFDSYWLAGVQFQWNPWAWGTSRRDREVLALQREIVAADELAFTEQIRRGATQDLATIDRLESALATDDQIIVLRERIAEETRARVAEAAVTSAEYVDRQSNVLSARMTRAIHRVELAQARARLLTALGIEVR